MINNFYLSPINQLTDEERSIFLYRFILKLSHQQIAVNLHKPLRRVVSICKIIATDRELLKFRKEIFEDFDLADML
jgi:hypothetical protein